MIDRAAPARTAVDSLLTPRPNERHVDDPGRHAREARGEHANHQRRNDLTAPTRVRCVNAVLGQLLPLAVAIVVSPIPLIAVILMLLAPGVGRTRLAFVLGWVVGIVAATTLFTVLAATVGLDSDDDPSSSTSWLRVALGAALVWLAARQWRQRPAVGADSELPSWLRGIDHFTPPRAGVFGLGLTAVNPKNLLLCLAAGSAIGGSALPDGEMALAIALFSTVASCGVVGIVVAHAVARGRMDDRLTDLRVWLEANNAAVMSVVLLVMGAVLIGNGLSGS